jgi:hypothetical protein
MILASDVSQYQGTIDWATMPPIALIKMSGGDNGLYMDSHAAVNYTNAKASGKAVGGYHFIGWTLGAVAEATYFLQAMSPLAENDVYALDIEAIKIADPVSYVQSMVDFIHGKIGVWPLVYMNVSTLKAFDWSSVLSTCGLWLADWNNDPSVTIPTVHTYVMQQYSDGPNYDHDEWFGTLTEFNAYGYHAPTATATPVQTTQPVSEPVSTTTTTTEPSTTVTAQSTSTSPSTATVSTVPTTVDTTQTKTSYTPSHTTSSSWWILRLFRAILRFLHL